MAMERSFWQARNYDCGQTETRLRIARTPGLFFYENILMIPCTRHGRRNAIEPKKMDPSVPTARIIFKASARQRIPPPPLIGLAYPQARTRSIQSITQLSKYRPDTPPPPRC